MVEMDNGIAEIMNPYIARVKAGIKEYEQNAILVEISEKMESYCRSFFSRDDLGDSSVILMHEFERYFKDIYLCIVSPLYHELLVASVAEKVVAGLVKRSGRGI